MELIKLQISPGPLAIIETPLQFVYINLKATSGLNTNSSSSPDLPFIYIHISSSTVFNTSTLACKLCMCSNGPNSHVIHR